VWVTERLKAAGVKAELAHLWKGAGHGSSRGRTPKRREAMIAFFDNT